MAEAGRVDVNLGLNSASFETAAQRARRTMRESMAGIQSDVGKSRAALEGITASAKNMAVGLAGAFSIRAVGDFAAAIARAGDQAQQLQAKLNLAVGPGAFQAARDSAQKLGVSIDTVAAAMARLGFALQGKVGASQLQGMVETLVEMGRIAGATGEEINAALTQLSQGLAKGRLDGDELGSVLEALPPIGRAIAQEMGVAVGELRDLGAEGKITADVVISAMQNVAGETRRQFETLPESLDAATARMANSWQQLMATFDSKLAASGWYKWFSSEWTQALDDINARLNVVGVNANRGQLAALAAELQAEQAKLDEMLKNPMSKSGPGVDVVNEQMMKVVGLQQAYDDLSDSIDKANEKAAEVQHTSSLSLFRAAQDTRSSPSAPTFVSRDDNERTVLAAARDLTDEQRELEAAQRDAKAAADAHTAALKRQGQTYENLTDAGTKLIRAIRRREDAAIPMGAPANQSQLTDRFRAERESMDALAKYEDQVRKDQEAQTQRLADLQADILVEPWRRMADEVAGIADDMFSDLLDDGKVSADALADTFTKSINSTISSFASTLVTQPLQKAVAEIGSGQYSSIGQYFSQNRNTLQGGFAGGAAGIAAGQIGGQALGLDGKYSAIGGAVGAVAGGIIGAYVVPGIGAAPGAFIGGTLGSLAGGLIGGGGEDLGNDKSAQVYGSGRGIIYGDESFSQGNRSITSGILGEVETLQEALGDLGATFKDFQIRVEAGNKTGITVDGVKYDTAEDALRGSIEKLLGARTGGLTATQQTILANTKGGSAAEIGADLAFGEQYDRLTSTGNNFDTAIRDLNQSMAAARITAEKLGLDVGKLDQALAEGQAEIERQRNQATRNIWSQLAAFNGDNSLQTQLFGLETQMRELAKAATDLGVPFEVVTQVHQRAADQLVETYYENIRAMQVQQRTLQQSILDARRGVVGAIDQYLDPIKAALGSQGIGQGVYSGIATTGSAVDEFRALLGMAREGDTSALSQLTGAGQAAIQSAQATYGSGAEFAAIFREIEAGLQSQQGQLEAKRDAVLQHIGDVGEQTVDEIVRLRIETVGELQTQFDRLSRDIVRAVEGAR